MKKIVIALSLALAFLSDGFCQSAATAEQKEGMSDTNSTPEDHMPRNYFREADDSKFNQVAMGLDRAKVRELCGGTKYYQFETIRDGRFAFAVDNYPAGVLSLPGRIRLDQEIDFFVSKERKKAIVVFFKEEKADWILIFDFSTGRWEKPANQALLPTTTAVTPAASHPPRQP